MKKVNLFNKVKYILPLFGIIILLIYFESILQNSKEKFEDRIMSEEIHWVNNMTNKFDSEENMYNSEDVSALARDYMISMVENVDKEKGIFACVLDTSFNLISERFTDEEISVDTIRISESDKQQIVTQKSGYVNIKIGNKMMNTFFAPYPKNEVEYHILIGVSPYVFDEIFNIQKITIVFFIIIIITFAGVYWNILDIKKKKDK